MKKQKKLTKTEIDVLLKVAAINEHINILNQAMEIVEATVTQVLQQLENILKTIEGKHE